MLEINVMFFSFFYKAHIHSDFIEFEAFDLGRASQWPPPPPLPLSRYITSYFSEIGFKPLDSCLAEGKLIPAVSKHTHTDKTLEL